MQILTRHEMSLFRGFNSIFRRVTPIYAPKLQKFSTDGSVETPNDIPIETPSPLEHPSDRNSNYLVRNLVQHKRAGVNFPTAMVVHLMGRVVEATDTIGKTRGFSDGTYAKFYVVTGHKSPDGVVFTQRHRLVVHKTNEEAYEKCHSLQRNDIAQISGELNYRYYFERKIGMNVPYTEILVSHLHFTTSAFSGRFSPHVLGPVGGTRDEDTRETMETEGESGMY